MIAVRSGDIYFPDGKTQASSAIGFGQRWSNASHAANTWYQNTDPRTIAVYSYGSIGTGIIWYVGPSTSDYVSISMSDGDGGDSADYGWILVPPYHYYQSGQIAGSPRRLA